MLSFRAFIFSLSVRLLTLFCGGAPFFASAQVNSVNFAARSHEGLRVVAYAPHSEEEAGSLKIWGDESRDYRYKLKELGILTECLVYEEARARGFFDLGAAPSDSLSLDIYKALGEALYLKFPWDTFSLSKRLSQSWVWEKSQNESSKHLFDTNRVYASWADVLNWTRQLKESPLCRERLLPLKKEISEEKNFYINSDDSFLGWDSRGFWVGLSLGRNRQKPRELLDSLQRDLPQ